MPTPEPKFARPFTIPLPLFENKGGTTSPWLTEVAGIGLEHDDTNLKYCTTIYGILKSASEAQMIKSQSTLDGMVASGQTEGKDFEELRAEVLRLQAAAANGGAKQTPWVSHDQYAFPIYGVKRDARGLVTTDLPIARYDCNVSGVDQKGQPCDQWEPPWPFRSRTNNGGWIVNQVPVPAPTEFASAGPQSLNSDGTVILFDEKTGIEYDFWQATVQVGVGGQSLGGGLEASQMQSSGSLSTFQTTGLGARNPDVDPRISSRASGLPYLGGLILPEDFAEEAGGWIKHALAFSLPQLRYFKEPSPADPPNWVYPATGTEMTSPAADKWALAAGQRIKLEPSINFRIGNQIVNIKTQTIIDKDSIPLVVRSFLNAILKYGAYLVDGGNGFGFAAEDSMTANPAYSASHVKQLIGDIAIGNGKTLWASIIDELDEWLSWKLGERLFQESSSLAFALEDEKENLIPNFRVVKNLKPP